MRLSAVGRHALRSGALSLAVLVLAGLAAHPAGAACTCSVNASVSPPTLNVSATSSGSCAWNTSVRLAPENAPWGPSTTCSNSTTCTANTSWSISCQQTGEHTVSALCSCGKAGTGAGGTPTCSEDWGSATTTYTVNSTPTVGVSPSGPDATGRVTFSIPYAFPNTTVSASRDLYLNVDGTTKATASSQTVSGTWSPALDMSCWAQGSHPVRAVVIACAAADPSYRADAFGSVAVDHQPHITLSLTPADSRVPDGRRWRRSSIRSRRR